MMSTSKEDTSSLSKEEKHTKYRRKKRKLPVKKRSINRLIIRSESTDSEHEEYAEKKVKYSVVCNKKQTKSQFKRTSPKDLSIKHEPPSSQDTVKQTVKKLSENARNNKQKDERASTRMAKIPVITLSSDESTKTNETGQQSSTEDMMTPSSSRSEHEMFNDRIGFFLNSMESDQPHCERSSSKSNKNKNNNQALRSPNLMSNKNKTGQQTPIKTDHSQYHMKKFTFKRKAMIDDNKDKDKTSSVSCSISRSERRLLNLKSSKSGSERSTDAAISEIHTSILHRVTPPPEEALHIPDSDDCSESLLAEPLKPHKSSPEHMSIEATSSSSTKATKKRKSTQQPDISEADSVVSSTSQKSLISIQAFKSRSAKLGYFNKKTKRSVETKLRRNDDIKIKTTVGYKEKARKAMTFAFQVIQIITKHAFGMVDFPTWAVFDAAENYKGSGTNFPKCWAELLIELDKKSISFMHEDKECNVFVSRSAWQIIFSYGDIYMPICHTPFCYRPSFVNRDDYGICWEHNTKLITNFRGPTFYFWLAFYKWTTENEMNQDVTGFQNFVSAFPLDVWIGCAKCTMDYDLTKGGKTKETSPLKIYLQCHNTPFQRNSDHITRNICSTPLCGHSISVSNSAFCFSCVGESRNVAEDTLRRQRDREMFAERKEVLQAAVKQSTK